MHSIIDGDGLLFQAAYKVNNLEEAYEKMKDKISWVTSHSWDQTGDFTMFLEGPGNWRFDVFDGYKASRGSARSKDEYREVREELKQYLFDTKLAIPAIGCESDDLVRRKAENMRKRNQPYIIVSADKDLDMAVGPHLRFNTKNEIIEYEITEEDSDRNYFYQMLVGDMTDNIQHPKGFGPKKAEALLKDTPRKNWKKAVEKVYQERCGSEWLHALYFTTSLTHIQRHKDDYFNWNDKGTWFDLGFSGPPKCYNYTQRMLGNEL